MKFPITKKSFTSWLYSFSPARLDTVIGTPLNGESCPLATCIHETTEFKYLEVDEDYYYVMPEDYELFIKSYFTPLWAGKIVKQIDIAIRVLATSDNYISAGEAIKRLKLKPSSAKVAQVRQ